MAVARNPKVISLEHLATLCFDFARLVIVASRPLAGEPLDVQHVQYSEDEGLPV